MVKTQTAYLLWLLGLCGFGGIHRMYLGKPVSGLFYLLTGGVFFIGQLVDLALIPGMVDDKNLKYKLLHGGANIAGIPQVTVNIGEDYSYTTHTPVVSPTTPRLDVQVLKVCRDAGAATLSDCVIETGADPAEIKATVQKLCLDGLLIVDNRDTDGAVVYRAI